MSTQKLPMVLRFAASDSAYHRNGQHDAHGRGTEVVIGEAGHLREIAHRGLAAVVLPVGIGGEGSGGVEGEIGAQRWPDAEDSRAAIQSAPARSRREAASIPR